MRKALLVSADPTRSQSIILALESEHDIWQVARHRDAMAWLRQHQPQTVIIDLDLDGLDAGSMLYALTAGRHHDLLIIGLCRDPAQLAPELASMFDQLIRQ